MKLFAFMVCLVLGCSSARADDERNTFLVNGENVNAPVPFYAYLEIYRLPELQDGTYFGGGTLITEYNILTVAQNVNGFQSWRAGLGSTSIKDLTWHTVDSALVHPNYNSTDLANNIAILNFAVPISPYSKNIMPIVLAASGSAIPEHNEVGEIIGLGFGAGNERPSILQYAQMTVLSQDECAIAYPHLIENKQLENHFCASNVMTGTNICGGDQGGPMYSSRLGLVFGIQLFNRMENCTLPESGPAAFIKVSRYGMWIRENTRYIN